MGQLQQGPKRPPSFTVDAARVELERYAERMQLFPVDVCVLAYGSSRSVQHLMLVGGAGLVDESGCSVGVKTGGEHDRLMSSGGDPFMDPSRDLVLGRTADKDRVADVEEQFEAGRDVGTGPVDDEDARLIPEVHDRGGAAASGPGCQPPVGRE